MAGPVERRVYSTHRTVIDNSTAAWCLRRLYFFNVITWLEREGTSERWRMTRASTKRRTRFAFLFQSFAQERLTQLSLPRRHTNAVSVSPIRQSMKDAGISRQL